MRHLSLFTGIGGLEIAAQTVWGDEWEPVLFCEIDEFCQKVLKKHWPDVPIHSDIKDLNCEEYSVDLLTGGFPCQPYSVAGKQKGAGDDRALWPEMLRIIQEAKPTWVIGENVAGFVNMGLDDCVSDLEAEGYEVQSLIIPACAVDACHRRDRVWIIAHAEQHNRGSKIVSQKIIWQEADRSASGVGRPNQSTHSNTRRKQWNTGRPKPKSDKSRKDIHDQRCPENVADPSFARSRGLSESNGRHDSANLDGSNQRYATDTKSLDEKWGKSERTGGKKSEIQIRNRDRSEHWYEAATRICRIHDGTSRGLDRTARLKALGNTIQWKVAAEIMQAIKNSC